MTAAAEHIVDRALVEAYFDAFAARDTEAFAAFLHDDVRWTISGPVDIIPYCGVHVGKAAVIDVMARRARNVLGITTVVREHFLVQGNRGAALTRLTATLTADGRTISYRIANFFRFQDGKLIENVSLMDSFDAAEQVLGHNIDLAAEVGDAPPLADGNIVTL
ncbi:MAG: nuclear transport factor 2 family protein [Proteobacteria bacterium]|nr:nuclear transport factor 2 family protein [Pseudomonadota bacterium]